MGNENIKISKENGELVCDQVRIASSMDERMMGLMFKKELVGYKGLLIDPCNSIHTFFMLMNIDVVFIGKNDKVIKIIRGMKPWRMTRMYFKARKVLEMKAGTLPENLFEGDILREYV